MKAKKEYVLYDARANYDEDDATVYCCADSLKEAQRDKRTMFPDARDSSSTDVRGDELINGRRVS